MFTYRITDEFVVEINTHIVERAADLFSLLSTPVRLRIVLQLCSGEKSVSELLVALKVGQPNVSQHLTMMYRAGLVSRRKQGAQVFYRIANDSVIAVCKTVCTQVATDMGKKLLTPAP